MADNGELRRIDAGKGLVWRCLDELEETLRAGSTAPQQNRIERLLRSYHGEDARWEIFCPIDTLRGPREAAERFWMPLLTAVPDLERRTDIFAGDIYRGECWVTSMGHLCGTFSAPWLEIPPTDRLLYVRIGEFFKVEGDRIVETHVLLDIPDVMKQAGVSPFPFQPGFEGYHPGPKRHNGIRAVPPMEADRSTLETVLAMHAALHDYDGRDLGSMDHSRFWSPRFHYYGPAGIGTTRGMEQFRRFHQRPFLDSFPDRAGRDHYCRIGDGPIACTTHWGTLTATHSGSSWLGLPATGKRITMRVADWYSAAEDGRLEENWLFLDIPDICRQMGVDLFARMRLRLHGDQHWSPAEA
jgi:predicted ester cyclase